MGKAIEEIALQRGHEISLKISSANKAELTKENLQRCDIAIEFTNPENAINNLHTCIDTQVPVICGSTGWVANEEEIKNYCTEKKGALLFASNFSIGVNIFFAINQQLAAKMNAHPQYNVSMQEVHHTQKLDAPSGTAVTLAEGILQHYPNKTNWVNHTTNNPTELGIESLRIDPAPGTHSISYTSDIDSIEIIHTAHSRIGFASGAVVAAEFIFGKQGIFTMKDVLGL